MRPERMGPDLADLSHDEKRSGLGRAGIAPLKWETILDSNPGGVMTIGNSLPMLFLFPF